MTLRVQLGGVTNLRLPAAGDLTFKLSLKGQERLGFAAAVEPGSEPAFAPVDFVFVASSYGELNKGGGLTVSLCTSAGRLLGQSTLVLDSFALRRGEQVERTVGLTEEGKSISRSSAVAGTVQLMLTWAPPGGAPPPRGFMQELGRSLRRLATFKNSSSGLAAASAPPSKAPAGRSALTGEAMDPVAQQRAREAATETLRAAFRFFDTSGRGTLSDAEMLRVLTTVLPGDDGAATMTAKDAADFISDFVRESGSQPASLRVVRHTPLREWVRIPPHQDHDQSGMLDLEQWIKGMVALAVPEAMLDDGVVDDTEADAGLLSAAEALGPAAAQQREKEAVQMQYDAEQRRAAFKAKVSAYSFRKPK